MKIITVKVGGSIEEDGAAFIEAWKASERGETVELSRTLSFESWEALSSVLTGERYRMLRHLHDSPEPSVSSLARSLNRAWRRVHGDVVALESAGLVDRSGGLVTATADCLAVEVRL